MTPDNHTPDERPAINLATIDELRARGPQPGDPFIVPGGESIIYSIQGGVAIASTHLARIEDLTPAFSRYREVVPGGSWCGAWRIKDGQELTRRNAQATLLP